MNETFFLLSSISVLQLIFSLCLLVSAILVNLSSNPVESVLFLVLTFITSGVMLMSLFSEFFGITVIIIYVGAIAVLFLFVIMMLNIKGLNNLQESLGIFKSKLLKFCICSSVLYIIFLYFSYKTSPIFSNTVVNQDNLLIDKLDNIGVLGQVLYNYYIDCFLIAGLLLLVALLGSICLTLSYNNNKNRQLPNKQLSRSDKFLSFIE